MSRSRPFIYTVSPRTPQIAARADALCPDHHGIMPDSICAGGASSPEGVEVFLLANRARARRIAERLDAYFGVQGTLSDASRV